jgi:uncharacterized protein YbaR (Trm112 family)
MIALLRCPRTQQPLAPAPAGVTERLLAQRESLRNLDGEMPELFESGLVTVDGAWFYPVRGGIPVLLAGDAIALTSAQPT